MEELDIQKLIKNHKNKEIKLKEDSKCGNFKFNKNIKWKILLKNPQYNLGRRI
jgi:hypothetical protein